MLSARASLTLPLLLALGAAGCHQGGPPDGFGAPLPGDGPLVRWDVYAEDLPDIPLPNDVATWPDPTSPSGRRLNASLLAPTGIERLIRSQFDTLDGWSTSGAITVSFEAPIDTDELIARQGRGRFSEDDFRRHAIYLINLETGVPVPLDINTRMRPYTQTGTIRHGDGDPREGESSLIFETVDEDTNGNGVLDPGEDTDFDGVLDEPNTLDGTRTAEPFDDVDRMLSFYERQTDTLVVRPLVPLIEQTEYAVVMTDRLVGLNGDPVRSPLDHAHHIRQVNSLAPLADIFASRPHIYGGDLAADGWDHVALAWTFTTQSIRGDIIALRDGLYGRGPFAHLADEFTPSLTPVPLRGGSRTEPCDPGPRVLTITADELRALLETIGVDMIAEGGIGDSQVEALLATLDNLSHISLAFFESPYLLGDPEADRYEEMWQMDRRTGEARISRGLVPMLIAVPRESDAHQQPFPVALYAHGYGSHFLESIIFAGTVATHGVATVAIGAAGHGLPADPALQRLLGNLLGTACLEPLGRALTVDRITDYDGDDVPDNAGLFYSAYSFHTRDSLRQTALDWLMAVRILRSFDGDPRFPDGREWIPGEVVPEADPRPLVFDGDVDSDGDIDRMGDLDGDGVVDLGGWDRPYFQWGSSLGGVVSMLVAGVEPAIHVAAPISGGASLTDISIRTEYGPVLSSVWLRTIGPVLVAGPGDVTGCAAEERSIYFHVPNLLEQRRVGAACLPADELGPGDAVIIENLANDERRCAVAADGGRVHIPFPSSRNDPVRILIHRGAGARLGIEHCTFEEDEAPTLEIDSWGVLAAHEGERWEAGEPLVSPAEGLGRRRQSPELRRMALFAQLALDPGDPINYARHIFLDPATAEDVAPHDRSVLVLATAGDQTVPPSSAYTYARAAGILPFLPADAPDELAEYRAPADFAATHGAPTPMDVLIDTYSVEGLSRFDRHAVPGTTRGFVFDVDDISEGRAIFTADGGRQIAPGDMGFSPPRPTVPLRWARQSRPMDGPTDNVFDLRLGAPTSALLTAYILPIGHHVILPTDPAKLFDDGEYFANLVGWYYGSLGTDLLYLSDPAGHHCLEESTCIFGR